MLHPRQPDLTDIRNFLLLQYPLALGTAIHATPLIAAIVKQPNFSNLVFTVNGSQFMYGDFINSLVAFLIDAAAIYFFVVLPVNKLMNRFKGPPPEVTTKICDFCKSSDVARDATKCPHCTSVLA